MLTLKERWHARCHSLRHWVETHNGHLPKKPDTLPCGFSIGDWLIFQRKLLRRQRLEAVKICALDDAAPGWRSSIAVSPEGLHKRLTAVELELEDRFTANVRDVAAFVAEHGSIPRDSKRGTATDYLAVWLANQRKHVPTGRLSVERVQHLDHIVPGWRTGQGRGGWEQRWQDSLASLVARVKELGRLPTRNERSAQFMYMQRYLLKQGSLSEDRKRALDEAMPGWNERSSRRENEQSTDSTGSPILSGQARI